MEHTFAVTPQEIADLIKHQTNLKILSKVQLYVHIDDLMPTEPAIMPLPDKFNDPDEEKLAEHGMDTLPTWLEDMKENGIKYALCVDKKGRIKDGNGRYWVAKALGIKFLPIKLSFLAEQSQESVYPKEGVIRVADDRKKEIKEQRERFEEMDRLKRL